MEFPHLFSLISPQHQEAEGEAFSDANNANNSDGFKTPRSSESLSTPRSLFSTPPRSPPKTPPRPTSHVDDRLRMRRYKLSMSSSSSPSSSPSKPRRINNKDESVLSCGAEEDDDANDCMATPENTPNNSSPRKNKGSSPLQLRLARARTKRQQILEERIQQIEVKSMLKEQEASKRKEDMTRETIEKARTELAKGAKIQQRRDQQVAAHVQSVEASLETKSALAQGRLERHLYEKQQRASCKERKERADRRRKLISYEKRAKLLASLDAKLERAAIKSSKLNEEKATKAGEDISKAKEVSRRVKAARTIQCMVRHAYGIESTGYDVDLSQHDAAERLQRWFQWRAHVCKRRLYSNDNDGDDTDAIKAIKQLLELFPISSAEKQQPVPSFEQISQIMMQPLTLKMAMTIVDSLRPINEVSFGRRAHSASSKSTTLLSLCLIALHPREVLGDGYEEPMDEDDEANDDRVSIGSRLLASNSRRLLQALSTTLFAHNMYHDDEVSILKQQSKYLQGNFLEDVKRISTLCLSCNELFAWWKREDMSDLLEGLSKQLEQSWVVYLTSSETLKYLAEVTGVDSAAASSSASKTDDPLMSVRLRHEASRNGSRSHIKRIRISLNKLIGDDEAKGVVKNAKQVAQREIVDSGAMQELQDEIDEIYGNVPTPALPTGSAPPSVPITTSEVRVGNDHDDIEQVVSMSDVDLPDEILSNRMLVHKILLTDPIDFGSLSWDGSDAQLPNASPEEFISSFNTSQEPSSSSATTQSMVDDMSMRIAQTLRLAFFNSMAQEMKEGNYDSVRDLLRELHAKMRSLLPSREDLHSHLNDEHISLTSSTSDVLRVLIRSGYLLSTYLESSARAPTTRELIKCLEAFNSRLSSPGSSGVNRRMIPYDIESEELFSVASIAYILHKAELCQVDVSNYKLSQAAPLLHLVGYDYEREHFKNSNGGDYSTMTFEELQHMIPSTWNWIKTIQSQFGSSENITAQSNLEQRMDFVKGRGFVDGILFTRSQLALPEFLSLDVESIGRIRSEARACVIASALALHACNISKVGTSVLSTNVMSNDVDETRQALSIVLRKKHFRQEDLEAEVTEAIGNLTSALAERDLTEEELALLSNHALAVLKGNDPVLKLLDNRVQSFFRFACKWKSDTASSGSTTAPLEMKTGRSILKGDNDDITARHGIKSTKKEFEVAAKKEVSRLGFGFFVSDLIMAGNDARGIISLACINFGQDILDRFFNAVFDEA